jgi:hypothetical protein
MAHNEEKNDVLMLQELLEQSTKIIDRLTNNGVKLRIKIGQTSAVFEKVFHHSKEEQSVLEVTEAIKHVALDTQTHLKTKP